MLLQRRSISNFFKELKFFFTFCFCKNLRQPAHSSIKKCCISKYPLFCRGGFLGIEVLELSSEYKTTITVNIALE